MARASASLKKRVVITGLGVVAPNGMGKDAFWGSVVAGRSAIDWITSFDVSDLYCQIAGQVRDFDPSDYMDRVAARRAGRFSHFAVAAARSVTDLPAYAPRSCAASVHWERLCLAIRSSRHPSPAGRKSTYA